MPTIAQIASPREIEAARGLILAFTAWVLSFEKSAKQAKLRKRMSELAALPGFHGPPTGRMPRATVDVAPAGCVALRVNGAETVALERLHARPYFLGLAIGAKLVAALIAQARWLGCRRLILDSHV
ncbi:MAG: hypothetical protein CVT71_01850 [Alphaproteobacteria bacterium HGW-Alphaproteobacteria-10]|nr:MAG: hypothetical protein CVT71_01850 [Alphaproteobacteria bacterium HGW-Alphaproteobacteria-10]